MGMFREREIPVGGRLYQIQGLRAAAILLVCAWHSVTLYQPAKDLVPDFIFSGYAGVDLFFGISGFIMMHITRGASFDAVSFIKKRIFRIIPLYWMVLSGLVLLYIFGFWSADFRGHSPAWFIFASYTLIPMEVRPLLGVAWSLQHEFIFYGIFAVLLSFNRRNYIDVVLMGFFLIGVCLHVLAYQRFGMIWDLKIFSLYHIEFASGVLSYRFITQWRWDRPVLIHLVGWAVFILTGFLCALMARHNSPVPFGRVIPVDWDGLVRVVGFAAANLLLISSAVDVHPPEKAQSAMVVLGDASYSIYLIHNIALQFIAKVTSSHIKSMLVYYCVSPFAILAVIGFGYLFHRLIEKPVLERLGV